MNIILLYNITVNEKLLMLLNKILNKIFFLCELYFNFIKNTMIDKLYDLSYLTYY